MALIVAVTVICLAVLYLCYLALPMGKGTLLGLAAVITALGGLIAAFVHLFLPAPGATVSASAGRGLASFFPAARWSRFLEEKFSEYA